MDLFKNLVDSLNENQPQAHIDIIDDIHTYNEKWGTDGRLIITSSNPKEVHAYLYNLQDLPQAAFISWHLKITNTIELKKAVSAITEMRDGADQDGEVITKFAI